MENGENGKKKKGFSRRVFQSRNRVLILFLLIPSLPFHFPHFPFSLLTLNSAGYALA